MSSEELATQIAPVESPQMVSTVKLPILKKGEYTLWSMRMEQQRERKAKSILLSAIPDEYQLRSHGIKDAKFLWAAIKSRFGGNVESKKMQKTVLKQQFENFFVSNTKGLDKAYDRLQNLISLLEVHGHNSQGQASSSSYPDDLIFSFFANQGHFARECKAPRKLENRNGDAWYRSRDNTRRTVPVETSDALVIQDNALIIQDGLGYYNNP
ncbi:hypothetical protein Tco_0303102 [Tanacetum coccineum]